MKRNIEAIQFLRFVAAALVTFYHSALFLNLTWPGTVPSGLVYLSTFGKCGVHVFFVISGFVMVYTSFAKEHLTPQSFWIRRMIRIFPIYWVYALVYLLYDFLVQGGTKLFQPETISSLLLLPNYSPWIIYQAWTLSYELYFYAWFALALIMRPPIGLALLTVIFLASIAVGLAYPPTNEFTRLVTSSLLAEFLAGAWIGYLVVSGVKIGRFAATSLIGVGLAGFLAGLAFGYSRVPFVFSWGLPSILLIAGIVFAEIEWRMPRIVRSLSFLGDSSYSLYLLHTLLIMAMLTVLLAFDLHSSGWFASMAICCVLTSVSIVVAAAAYKHLERVIVGALQQRAKALIPA